MSPRLRAAAITLTSLITVSVGGCSSTTELVQINVQSLLSDARDGSVLAGQIVAGRASSTFGRAHARELQDDVDQVEQNVYDERLPGHQAIQQLADQISTALGGIVIEPDNPSVARQARTKLLQLSDQASRMSP